MIGVGKSLNNSLDENGENSEDGGANGNDSRWKDGDLNAAYLSAFTL